MYKVSQLLKFWSINMENVLLPLSMMICGFIFFIVYSFLPRKLVNIIDKTIIFPILFVLGIFLFILSILTGAAAPECLNFGKNNKE